jgi:hypothetical protein|tara:strand:- start:1575 stop:2057 length:483 start_codon:yes stop_codon:yes gene_type:complete
VEKENKEKARLFVWVCYHLRMVKTYITKCGKDIQVFINGDTREEAEPIHWSLFNHGATNQADPEWIDQTTFSFWTQRSRLLRAFQKAAINGIVNSHSHKFKGKRGALIPALADKMAARRMRQCVNKPYVRQVSVANLNCYGIGTICAEKPDSDHGNRETR